MKKNASKKNVSKTNVIDFVTNLGGVARFTDIKAFMIAMNGYKGKLPKYQDGYVSAYLNEKSSWMRPSKNDKRYLAKTNIRGVYVVVD